MAKKHIIIVRTLLGLKYAKVIAKKIESKEIKCGITKINDLKDYLKKNNCSPKDTIIHTRTASPGKVYESLKDIEKKGYKIINSAETIRLTSDKFNSCVHAIKKRIPCAKTYSLNKNQIKKIKDTITKWNTIIIKPTTSQGQGVYCLRFDKKNLDQLDKIQKIPTKRLVIQKFIDYSKLNRVIVIGYKSLNNAVFWDSPKKGWKCSVCLNPNIKHYKNPPKELLKLAEDIAKKFKAKISFIDIFATKKGYILSEINTACNLMIHEKKSKCNISKKIAEYLIKQFR